MSYLKWLPILTLALAGCGDDDGATGAPDAGTTRTLILLHTNDEHSHLIGDAPEQDDYPPPTTAGTGTIRGGAARRASVLAQERAAAQAAGADTLTLSGGDNSQSTLMQVPFALTAPDYRVMKAAGYDVTTLGNHEFDQTPAGLASAISYAVAHGGAPQIVASNIQFSDTDPGDDALAALFDESGTDATKPIHRTWTITTPNGLKVGFVGYLGVIASTYAPFKTPVTFSLPAGATENDTAKVTTQLFADLQKAVDHLRNDVKVDVVIALSHAGVNMADVTKGEDYQVATNVQGIDVIVSGHTHSLFPIMGVENPISHKKTYIQQANYYGYHLGKIVLKVDPDGAVSADLDQSKLIPIDDTIVASDPTVSAVVDDTIKSLEGDKIIGTQSFLEHTLSELEGAAVTDDATKIGDLYFRPLGKTTFDVIGNLPFKETPLMALAADADLAMAEAIGGPTDLAVIAAGTIRADLRKGKTGNIAFNDVFNVLPLGISPGDGTVGYPLTRFTIFAQFLKDALELSTGYAYSSDDASTYYMVTSGMKIEYDTNRPEFDSSNPLEPTNGRITKITLSTNHADPDDFDTGTVIFDLAAPSPGWLTADGAFTPFVITTSLYIASFAASHSITLLDPEDATKEITLEQAILKHADGSEVKEWEALGAYVKAFPNAGTIDARYNYTTPKRMICSGPVCVQ